MARERLVLERRSWKKDHPHGMVAKPTKLPDGGTNWMVWEAKIPGPAKVRPTSSEHCSQGRFAR